MKPFTKWMGRFFATAVCLIGLNPALAADQPIQINWWHAMTGPNANEVNKLVKEFNQSQSKYHVNATYKGNYTQTLTSTIAAFRAHKQPDIVQVFEVGTGTMLAAKNAVVPVYKLMQRANIDFKPNSFIGAIKGYYTDSHGHMLSMPFNSSTPVLYYNRAEFKKAGLNPDNPPRTWQAMGKDTAKLRDAGVSCGFTTGWQSWIQLENFAAWHNLAFATAEDGFGGLDARLAFNKKPFVQHIAQMAKWTHNHQFRYGGRRDDPVSLFYSGECAMLFESTGLYGSVQANAKFPFGVGRLPLDTSVAKKPQNSIIGGASLWVLQGQPDSHYKGVAKFLDFLSKAPQQADWSRTTGYLPVTNSAYKLLKKQGFYKKHPGAEVAIKQLTLHKPTPNSKGLRLGNFTQIRDIINQELESVWSGKKSPEQALNQAVKRGNVELRKFQKTHS